MGNEVEEEEMQQIIEEIQAEIKTLCKNMLSKDSALRPSCSEILDKIHEIQNNLIYNEHLKLCEPFSALSLPPENIINPQKQNVDLNSSQCQSVHSSQSQSHCNSNKTEKRSKTSQSPISDRGNVSWFYQASPRCYNSLFRCNQYKSPSMSSNQYKSPIPTKSLLHNFSPSPQLNLSSAFNQTVTTNKSPSPRFVLFSPENNLFKFDKFVQEDQDIDASQAEDEDSDFKP